MIMQQKNKISNQIATKLFSFTRQTWTKWKEENRQITKLLQLYFSDKDLNEFLETGKIEKQELSQLLTVEELKKAVNAKFNTYNNKIDIHNLRLKIFVLPDTEKKILEILLQVCIRRKTDFSIDLAKKLTKGNPKKNGHIIKYLEKDRVAIFLYFIEKIITKEELDYINRNKKEIIEILQ